VVYQIATAGAVRHTVLPRADTQTSGGSQHL
jgi:hypothetical protein